MSHPHHRRMHRSHKTALHIAILACIAASLYVEARFSPADWLFVVLSVLVEVQ